MGYQPQEYLRGASVKTLKNPATGADERVFLKRNKDLISFSRPGIFGHCEAKTPALFMKNLKPDTCVVAYAPISDEICKRMNSDTIVKQIDADGNMVPTL